MNRWWHVNMGIPTHLSGGQTDATFDATFDSTLLHPMLRSFGHPVFSVTTPSNNVASSIQQHLLDACCNIAVL